VCFNAAKSWQTGWFNDKRVNMNIGDTGATDNCLQAQITGQSEYDVNLSQTILVKMNRLSGSDLFLMYNKKTGINIGTVEGGNMVMVVEANGEGTAYAESELVAKLSASQSYTAPNYLGNGEDLVISVLSIGATADVRIEYGGLCTTANPTPSVPTTPLPTPAPVNPPTANPTTVPTSSPTGPPMCPICGATGQPCCGTCTTGGSPSKRGCSVAPPTSNPPPTTNPPQTPNPTPTSCGGGGTSCATNGQCCSGTCRGNGICK